MHTVCLCRINIVLAATERPHGEKLRVDGGGKEADRKSDSGFGVESDAVRCNVIGWVGGCPISIRLEALCSVSMRINRIESPGIVKLQAVGNPDIQAPAIMAFGVLF